MVKFSVGTHEGMRRGGGVVSELQLHPFLNSALRRGELSVLRPSGFAPRKKSASPIYLEAGWVPESVRLLEETTNMLLLSEIQTISSFVTSLHHCAIPA